MTRDPNEAEHRRQAAEVLRYRYVLHAIRQLPVPRPPAGFAREVEDSLQDHPEDAAAERWLLRFAAAGALVLAAVSVGPWVATSATSLTAALGDVPWRLLIVIASGLAGFAIIDTLRSRASSH